VEAALTAGTAAFTFKFSNSAIAFNKGLVALSVKSLDWVDCSNSRPQTGLEKRVH
jgi:hypothetical protein